MLSLDRVTVEYGGRQGTVRALDEVSLHLQPGEFVLLQGPSGSGKTTLLMTAGGMLRPSAGRVTWVRQDLYHLSSAQRSAFRAAHVGFVFQKYHLMPYLDLVQNVLLAARGGSERRSRRRAQELLDQVGLGARRNHRPAALSAGEQQRVAVARALLNAPDLLLADEPTGNLDPETAAAIVRLFTAFRSRGGCVLMVTHDSSAAAACDRVLGLREGRLQEHPTGRCPALSCEKPGTPSSRPVVSKKRGGT